VVPLALTGANTTVGAVAAAALAGGPLVAMVAAVGAAALTVATTSNNRRKTGTRSGGRIPSQSRATSAGTNAGRGAGTPRTSSPGSRAGARHRSAGRHATGTTAGAARPETSRRAGRMGQVKALRAAQHAAAPSRAERRAQITQARRGAADARRAEKAAQRTARAAGKGRAGRTVAAARGRAAGARDAAVGKTRAARDAQARNTVAQHRSAVRKAPARRKARRALWRSAARLQGRRLLAALLAAPLGVLGMLTTPLGRKLGWAWLMYPGRRLYRRMVASGKDAKAERDAQIRADQEAEEAAADAAAEQDGTDVIGGEVERPEQVVPAPASTATEEVSYVSGFNFEEFAAEMENAARSYEPESAMEILAMVESLPNALTSVANTMRILAERADSEFPLEKPVADGFNDIFTALQTAVSTAEELGPVFRDAHEQDIARHEDPRNGPDAEKGWNV
jgi:hypothetical protein